jgi:hypothetical protein
VATLLRPHERSNSATFAGLSMNLLGGGSVLGGTGAQPMVGGYGLCLGTG